MGFLEVPEYADCMVERGSYVSEEMYGMIRCISQMKGGQSLLDLDPLPPSCGCPRQSCPDSMFS